MVTKGVRAIEVLLYAINRAPVKTPQNAAPDQVLHCLLTEMCMQNAIMVTTSS